jgi:mRNA interferase HigB
MQVLHWGRARRFFKTKKLAEAPLKVWREAVKQAVWKNFPDIQNTYGDASWVDGMVVFNIKAKDFRLVAIAQVEKEKIYIKHVMTHVE